MTQKITVTKTEDHYEMQFEGNDTAYPVPTSAIDKLNDEFTPDAAGDSITFIGEYGGHKHMKNFDVEEVVEPCNDDNTADETDESGAEDEIDSDDEAADAINPDNLEVGDELVRTTTRDDTRYEVVEITEEKTFHGTETVVIVTKNGLDEETIYERKRENFEAIDGESKDDDKRLMTDGGEERTECVHCETVHSPEAGIVTGKPEVGDDRTCNICLQDHLREHTVLSRRESEVAALKLLGYRHESIAELLRTWRGGEKPTKSTVDEYSSRMQKKAGKAAETVNCLERYL